MGQTMEQTVNLGLAFNPLAAADGQGEAFVGNAQNRLQDAMRENGWDDPRFLTKHQLESSGWKLADAAVPVQITFNNGKGWDNKVLFNAAQIEGVPPLDWMLSVAKVREADLAQGISESEIAPAPVPVHEVKSEGLEFDQEELNAWRQQTLAKQAGGQGEGMVHEDDDLAIGPARIRTIEDEELLGVTPIFREKALGEEGPAHVGEPVLEQMATALLNTRFKERVPGSGEYHREGEKKVAFFDKGESLIVRDKAADSYQAVMELAKSKGWKEIELNGKPEQKARGWLEAELMGIKVANYVPTEKDLLALDERRAQMGLPPVDREPTVPEGAKLVTEGRYIGPVVDVTKDYVVQSVGQGQFVAHPLKEFAPIPMRDDKLDVAYREGRVASWLPKVTSQEKSGGRER